MCRILCRTRGACADNSVMSFYSCHCAVRTGDACADNSVVSLYSCHCAVLVAHVLITGLCSVQNMLSYEWLYTLTSVSCRSVRNIVTYELRMC